MRTVRETQPLDNALMIIGKKFDLQIIDSINKNGDKARFNQIKKDIPSINPRILSMRLKELERNKVIEKHLILGTPVKTEYSLTKKATPLIDIIDKLKNWGKMIG
ncbi:MAG: helix-turn-helix transcriptional regulator [Candidatus Diapherotrites archaeon]|jgi:DNA-binding HxlR family transcriptional regulator|uniref:Helix-turn-helix transcriptional regulator n=1 Tax=Candidatus Iainarchaeum sp. TaxID=3101447 RepID=A0A7K4BZI0_9ARCH|nr:helix-turn-helix transcriptional regulator [Candidatus Diapherotrites archaeon]